MGVLVLQAITSGLNLAKVESEVRFMVTGAVLLIAVGIDSLSRRARSSSGSGERGSTSWSPPLTSRGARHSRQGRHGTGPAEDLKFL